MLLYFIFLIFAITNSLKTSASETAQNGLCPTKCQCYNTTVRCIFARYDKVPKNLHVKTTILDLRFNNIKRIFANDFGGLTNLHTLLLSNNRIERIDEGAFENLHKIRTLHLYKNRMETVHSNVFAGMEKLEILLLNNNSIWKIDNGAFSHQKNSLKRLYLNHNRLRSVPYQCLIGLKQLERLRLDANALTCDCKLKGLVDFLHEHPTLETSPAYCMYPAGMKGQMLRGTTMQCDDSSPNEESKIEIILEETVYLSCEPTDENSIEQTVDKIIWMHNSTIINTQEQSDKFTTLENGTLVINKPTEADQGFYDCYVKNSNLEKTRVRRHQLSYDSNDNRQRRVRSPKDVDVDLGDTARLSCVSNYGYPRNLEWSFDNSPIRPDSRTSILSNGDLIITGTGIRDAGQYYCNAVNERGQFSVIVRLHVRHSPEFTIKPQDITAYEGSRISMNCEAQGYPQPQVTWTKDSRQLHISRRLTLERNNTKLTIYPLLREDAGIFGCHAKNVLGTKQTSGIVHIKSSVPPRIIIQPQSQTAAIGATISFQCKATGEPTPRIVWSFNGIPVPTVRGHFEISHQSTLYVHEVTEADDGHFTCQAINDVGAVTADAVLSFQRQEGISTNTNVNDFNQIPGFQTPQFVNRSLIESSILQATNEVDRAINNTRRQLNDGRPKTPSELLALFRYPGPQALELARSREIYEQTLRILQQHVSQGLQFDLSQFSYEQILSPAHLQLISELAGCNVHREDPNCNDMCFHNKYRTYDGTCNNLQIPMRGASHTAFKRLVPPIYENGFNMPVGWYRNKLYYGFPKPNPRKVVNVIVSTRQVTPDPKHSHMLMQWGQFLDHDLDFAILAPSIQQFQGGLNCKSTCRNSPPCFNIDVPHDDPRIRNLPCIEMERSSAICGSGETSLFFNKVQPREQINQITSYIDASNVYGSAEKDALDLRDLFSDHGLMKFDVTSHKQKPLLPFNRDAPMDCRRNSSVEHFVRCFLAGDHRANEQLGLLAMHTLWLREHNRLAAALLKINPHWDGEKLYQESRKIVGAEMQAITYREWLPKILGPVGMRHIGEYKGYNPEIDSSVVNSFAAAAFRFGHTLIQPLFLRLNASFQEIPEGHILLHQAFFTPEKILHEGGIDPLLRGLFAAPAKLLLPDQFLNQELTEKLFAKAHEVALDLASLNIQRARDHAIAGYTEYRKWCNLSVPQNFDDLAADIPDAALRNKLQSLYGHPGNVDLFVGALSERPLIDAKIGPTFVCIIAEQFKRLRDGDRFYYENTGVFTQLQQIELQKTSLSKVLCNNGDEIDRVQKDAFIYPGSVNIQAYGRCTELSEINLNMWQECCSDSCMASRGQSGETFDSQPLHRYKREINMQDSAEERLQQLERLVGTLKDTVADLQEQLKNNVHEKSTAKMCPYEGAWKADGEQWCIDQCTTCRCENMETRCTSHGSACKHPFGTTTAMCPKIKF